ncbi:MAG: hypothetical protein QM497_09885 [Sulfurimonas sp.]
MANSLKGKFFVASREMYGVNSVKYLNLDLVLTNQNYDDSGNGFDWGNSGSGAKLLAASILREIGSLTIARVYTNKYTEQIIKKMPQDSWKLEAIEVAKWINNNTEFNVNIDEVDREEIQAKEEEKRLQHEQKIEVQAKEDRKVQREKEFQQKIKDRLQAREEASKKEHEKIKIEEDSQKVAKEQEYKAKAIKYQNELKIYKVKFDENQDELVKNKLEIERNKELLTEQKTEIQKYKDFLDFLDIPSLHEKFNNLTKELG